MQQNTHWTSEPGFLAWPLSQIFLFTDCRAPHALRLFSSLTISRSLFPLGQICASSRSLPILAFLSEYRLPSHAASFSSLFVRFISTWFAHLFLDCIFKRSIILRQCSTFGAKLLMFLLAKTGSGWATDMDVRQVYGQGVARPHGQYYPAPEPIRQDPRDLRRQDLCSELAEGACNNELSWVGLQSIWKIPVRVWVHLLLCCMCTNCSDWWDSFLEGAYYSGRY